MPRSAALGLIFIGVVASLMSAQGVASIRGVVRDSSLRPMPNSDVIVVPGGQRTRTDSTGQFIFGSLPAGQYTVRARRVGYGPAEWTIDLSNSGHANVQLILGARLAMLDTVVVSAGRQCEAQRYEGFMCRRATANGRFIDYSDIDTMQVTYSADLLRDVGGFGVIVRPSRNGPTRVASAKTCTIILMNGIEAAWSAIPEEPYLIIGIEVYKTPKDIPREYARYTWGKENCWLVAYWTYDFLVKPVAKPKLPPV
jgi:hypothetical protein